MTAHGMHRGGDWLETTGFHSPGDGGGALYQVRAAADDLTVNGADVLSLPNGVVAVLQERKAVNYRMFGALSNGANDDGVQIKLAHAYANRHGIPVVNPSGEFWINETNGIVIRTAVQWGKTIFHVDERHNDRSVPRFVVENDEPARNLTGNEDLRQALITQLKPGVQIIPELAPYANHLVVVQDAGDRIGIRAGYEGNRGWAREELFYVEEEGRIVGDIAWEFKGLTSVQAIPCNDTYLVIEGGGFRYSGDTPEAGKPGYYHNGIAIQRSRTVIREQWMGLEPGKRDLSIEPRHGLYSFSHVYDVTLENIRAMPWEKNRRPPETVVAHGTYGISGARMLNCTFRNVTAEGGWVAWGVFGTNLNKNFRFENCRLNRIDVHFHCWNLYITNCTIGFKGISVTGGGELMIENTTRHGNTFINFRRDYGATWDGPIRIRGCTLKPSGNGTVSVLSMVPADFDYQCPVGLGTSIDITDLTIDYAVAPASDAPCWLMNIASFSRNQHGQRLFFPQLLCFRNIRVVNREKGVRLLSIPNPYQYDLRRPGGCDDNRIDPNGTLICDMVQLERTVPAKPGDARQCHLVLGGDTPAAYADALALFPRIVLRECPHVALHLANCAASVSLEHCTVNTITAAGFRGEIALADCRLQPEVRAEGDTFYALDSTLGTRLTNCTVHAPTVDGKARPDLINRIGFMEVNRSLRYYHLNTGLGNEVVKHFREQGDGITPAFITMLKSHHAMEE
ncbi:MAG: hypothetical protein U1E05_05380 [Patescibacteria group bacterium]|nr:hypothetical protein [Patescibacteria group bacterium]